MAYETRTSERLRDRSKPWPGVLGRSDSGGDSGGDHPVTITPEAFRSALRDLGHTQRTFAAFARVNERSVRRWASGDQIMPGWAVVIIRLLDTLQRAGIAFPD